jgi:cyclophilin family peptidyl-prolyl cis-trans isomerase
MLTRRLPIFGAAVAAACFSLPAFQSRAQIVQVTTPLGDIYLEMLADDAPASVANFLNYINDGDYADSFFHRLAFADYDPDPVEQDVRPFVIQAGGFNIDTDSQFGVVPTDPPVINEPGVSNLRGTVAMAKLGGDPDSATSQWFINLNDNDGFPASLDTQNGGFTVFARVVQGMDVADAIAQLGTANLGGALTNLPLLDNAEPPTVDQDEVVLTSYKIVIPGDADGDGDVDDADLGIAFANYTGPVADGGKGFADGDTDFDGDVDDADLGIAFANYTGPLAAAAVPEPTSAALLGLAGLALVRRRRA